MKIYVDLFHGRIDPAQNMEDWGFSGPILGPFVSVSFTYLHHIRCNDEHGEAITLELKEDMIMFDGKYYGDFCIFHEDYFIARPDERSRILKTLNKEVSND